MTTPDPHLFRPTAGFLGAPLSHDLGGAKAAILGLPFDCGADASRIGSRSGPTAIREQAKRLGRPYPPFSSVDPIVELGLVDCGDARVAPGRIDESYEVIEAAVGFIADQGAVPVTMGGDGAVTLPQLRAMGRRHPGLVVLHFDAHTDAYPVEGQNRFTNATTFTCAAEEDVIDVASSYHIGTRGPCRFPDIVERARKLGYQVVTADELYARNIANVIAAVREAIGDRPVYLCWDMDFFDPSCAPGVCDPTWGGVSAREGLGILQSLAGMNIVACDVNTVSPPHDAAGMTALLAATVMLLCLHLVCLRP